jgi:uncharacterized coiled-coil protein SlyX
MRQGTLIGPIIIAIGLIAAAVIFALVGAMLQTADGGTELRLDRMETELDEVNTSVAALRAALDETDRALDIQIEKLALLNGQVIPVTSNLVPVQSDPLAVPLEDFGDEVETEEMTEVMKLAKSRFNQGITQPRNETMLEILGQPRGDYGTTCQSITNPKLKALVDTRQVGPIRVTLLKPALESLERIMAKLKQSDPDIYAALGTAGGLCVRLIRGSRSSISNHSFATAIDLKLEGKLDGFGDGGTQFGLLIVAELFNEEGWFWGATYRREDSMHFEVGEQTLRAWVQEGKI